MCLETAHFAAGQGHGGCGVRGSMECLAILQDALRPEWECRVLVHISLQGKTMVDVGFWGGMVPANSHNASELRAMLDAGALGFKSFFSPSGGCFFCNATRRLGLLLQPSAPPWVIRVASCTGCLPA
jgi:hypothetical protein